MGSRRANGEGSIFRSARGAWRAQVSLGGHRISHSARDRQAAVQWIREIQGQIEQGLTYDAGRITVSTYLQNWLISKQGQVRLATFEQYTWVVQKYLDPALGRFKLREISSGMVQAFYDQLSAAGKGSRTIRVAHAVLRGSLEHAKRMGLVHRNVAQFCALPRSVEKDLQIWSEAQVVQFLNFVHGHRNANLYNLALSTGMRKGELAGLQWSDIDWSGQMIQVRRECYHPDGGGFIFQSTKTIRGRRSIQLGAGQTERLRSQLSAVDLLRKQAGRRWQEHDLVFPSTIGTPQQPAGISHEFQHLVNTSGLPAIRFHDCRHTAASIMLSHGIPPVIVAGMLGHSITILLNTYSHLIPNMQGPAAQLMDELTTPIRVDLRAME